MKKKIIIAVVSVVVITGALAGTKVMQITKLMAAGASATQPPSTVSSAVVEEQQWQFTLSAIGTVAAVQGVQITADLAGMVREIAFESGAVVTNGALLVRLDTSSEDAQLRALDAQVELAQLNAVRSRGLRTENAISQAELDLAEANLKQLQANADTIRTAIEKKTIRAPFAGRLGIRLINLGEYLDTDKPIVSLQSLAPVYGNFTLPQQEMAKLKTDMHVRLTTDAYPGKTFEGILSAINPDLNAATRSVRLQATFANAEQLLRPGMFARMEVLLPDEQKVLAIPSTSILSAPYGDSVYVIEPSTNSSGGLVVRQQFVRTGRTRGDFVSIIEGLKAGEKVVSSGLFKLRNGMPVTENNELSPKSSTTPKPAEG